MSSINESLYYSIESQSKMQDWPRQMDGDTGGGGDGASRRPVSDTVVVRLQQEDSLLGGRTMSSRVSGLSSDMEFGTRPALFVPLETSAEEVGEVIYEKWTESERPALLVSLIAGPESDSVFSCRPGMALALKKGLVKILQRVDTWLLTCGLETDPLARAAGRAVRTLDEERQYLLNHGAYVRQHQSLLEAPTTDVKLMAINSTAIAPSDQTQPDRIVFSLEDSHDRDTPQTPTLEPNGWHTHFVLLDDVDASADNIENFRCQLFMSLVDNARRPGGETVEGNERYLSYPVKRVQTGVSSLMAVSSADPSPVGVVIFTGCGLFSLTELERYVRRGVAVLVCADASAVCECLRTAFAQYANEEFDHFVFLDWLDVRLRSMVQHDGPYCDGSVDPNSGETPVERAKEAIVSILRHAVLPGRQLLSFMDLSTDNLECVDHFLLDACLRAVGFGAARRRILPLIVRQNIAPLAYTIDIRQFVEENWCQLLFEEALQNPGRENIVRYFLDFGFSPSKLINAPALIRLFQFSHNRDFFQTVVLGHLLGYPNLPYDWRRFFRIDLNALLEDLSLLPNIFPSAALMGLQGGANLHTMRGELADLESRSFDVLAYWALLMNRGELAKLMWAHSHDPIPLALVLSQMCASLAEVTDDWYFYRAEMLKLSREFSQMAVDLLNIGHTEAAYRSYDVLCFAYEQYANATATHLAYQAENLPFIAHECCQVWTNRLLHGRIQLVNLKWGFYQLPSWLKIIVCAFAVFPMKWWVRPRGALFDDANEGLYENDTGEYEIIQPEREKLVRNDLGLERNSSVHRRQNGVHGDLTGTTGTGVYGGTGVTRTGVYGGTGVVYGGRIAMTQSNCSMLSVRSLRQDQLSPQDERAMAESRTMAAAPAATVGNSAQSQPTEVADGAAEAIQLDTFSPADSDQKHWKYRPRYPSVSILELLPSFYNAPIVKYWLSLIFRLIHLVLFGVALSYPGCGDIYLDLVIWVWSFISWCESMWLLCLKRQRFRWKRLRWQLVDVSVVAGFLVLVLVFKIVARQPNMFAIGEAFVGRVMAAFFLLYLCYSTLFVYLPMSSTLGPLLVRVKLMVMRDFVNYIILVSLVIASCAIVVHVIIYPDYPEGSGLWHQAFHWAWFSLFTTDLSGLKEQPECEPQPAMRFFAMPERSQSMVDTNQYCSVNSKPEEYTCPRPSALAYLAVIQYFVILKLISWPLLFALFGRTAKEVDDMADSIWKYQFYSLVMDFSMRPPLPPPLTPLVFVFTCCSNMCRGMRRWVHGATDHPDAGRIQLGSVTMPCRHRDNHYYSYWRALAIRYWEKHVNKPAKNLHTTQSFGQLPAMSCKPNPLSGTSDVPYSGTQIKAIRVKDEYRPWNVLLPSYYPPSYSKSASSFPESMRPFVDGPEFPKRNRIEWNACGVSADGQMLIDRRTWAGLYPVLHGTPLNPLGRCGIQGRGDLPRFGPNHRVVLILWQRDRSFLLCGSKLLSAALFKSSVVEPHLHERLMHCLEPVKIGNEENRHLYVDAVACVRETSSAVKSLGVGDAHSVTPFGKIAHIFNGINDSGENTDHAWVEMDVWSIQLDKKYSIMGNGSPLKWINANKMDLQECANLSSTEISCIQSCTQSIALH